MWCIKLPTIAPSVYLVSISVKQRALSGEGILSFPLYFSAIRFNKLVEPKPLTDNTLESTIENEFSLNFLNPYQ